MNSKKLRSVMVLNGDNVEDLAAFLEITPQALRKKINEDGTCFKQTEISRIIERYALSADETVAIFFS